MNKNLPCTVFLSQKNLNFYPGKNPEGAPRDEVFMLKRKNKTENFNTELRREREGGKETLAPSPRFVPVSIIVPLWITVRFFIHS